MVFAAINFADLAWLPPLALGLVFALGVVAWSYRAAPAGPLRWMCAFLKTLGLAALAFCLLEPLWSGQRARPGANLFAILADNSQSLQVREQGQSRTRGDSLREALGAGQGDWQAALAEQFEVRRFFFDSRLHAANNFGELTFDGRASSLAGALRAVTERFAGRPLAGVLLLTDGNATDIHGSLPAFKGLPPVHPVVIGQAGGVRDLAVARVNVSQTAFEDAPVSIQADVAALGWSGETVVARLLDAAGQKVEERTARVRKHSETLAFRFELRPKQAGLLFYRLQVRARTELEAASGQGTTAEATLLNNSEVITVDRGRGPYRILYVAGRPNWEYKFLNRAVQEDEQLHLVALIRIALREPKFDFRGRGGESGNPLFRGFGNQAREEVERYDQPVLVRLNTRDELELRGGFPRTPEDLYGFHAVILDDVESAFFAPDQAALLQKFVSERGGGLLMLGGVESFQQGQYQRTPIGGMLPIYLDRAEETAAPGPLKFNLAREGWLQSWARLRDNESDEKTRLQAMPPFQVLNRVREIKPGASVLATVADDQGKEQPALVTQRFGRGRTAALLVGDLWRWGMRDPEARHDMEKAWRQLARWLVADVPGRVDLTVQPPDADGSGAVPLRVLVRDAKFQPVDDATVTLEINPVLTDSPESGTNRVRLRAEASVKEPGLYEARFLPRTPGGYHVAAAVTNNSGVSLGSAETGWTADPGAGELRSLEPNRPLLAEIARQSGGEMVAAARLAEFVRRLPARQAPVMEAYSTPFWHTPWYFLFALACLVAEWGLRRWKGLP